MVLIGLLILIALASLKGFKNILDGFTPWTYLTLGLVTLTLVVASFSIVVTGSGLTIGINGRFVSEVVLMAAVWVLSAKVFSASERQEWCLRHPLHAL